MRLKAVALAIVALALVPANVTGSTAAAASSDVALKAQVLREAPGLREHLRAGRRYAAARAILAWTAPRIPWYEPKAPTVDVFRLSAGEIWNQWFKPRRAGVWCGGAAVFYVKMLKLFGISATTMDFGDLEVFTHVTTLVKRRSGEWVVLDPTFNLELLSQGRPVPLVEAIRLHARGRTIRARTAPLGQRWYIRAKGRPVRCKTLRDGGCGLRHLRQRRSVRRAGWANGADGLLRMMREGDVFGRETVPPEVLDALRRYGAFESRTRTAHQ